MRLIRRLFRRRSQFERIANEYDHMLEGQIQSGHRTLRFAQVLYEKSRENGSQAQCKIQHAAVKRATDDLHRLMGQRRMAVVAALERDKGLA